MLKLVSAAGWDRWFFSAVVNAIDELVAVVNVLSVLLMLKQKIRVDKLKYACYNSCKFNNSNR